MCSKVILVVLLCFTVKHAIGFAIREKPDGKEDFSAYFHTLASYKRRLQNEGIIPTFENEEIPSSNSLNFDELEVLQLIPATIKQLRNGKLSQDELEALHKIFGSLWDLIVEDANRKRFEPRNHVLSDLLRSREIRFGKREIRQHLNNDIQGNSVQLVYKPDKSRSIKLSDNVSVEPSQRLLRMVAAIVQKSYRDKTASRSRSKRSDSINFENVKVTIKVPPRVKRSIYSNSIPMIKKSAGLTAEQQRRVDEANEAAIMAAVLAQIGNNGLDSSSDSSYDDDDDDDQMADDYYDDDEDYPEQQEPSKASDTKEDKAERKEIEANNKQNDGQTPSLDYAYDDTGRSDDYYTTDFRPRFNPGDFENPSINELIMLAARHHAKKQSKKVATSF